jgi:CheY-like chemotaxis protein/predicted RNA-binding Zn-ribbon protein involved in translation (DUF1610 family)
MSRLGPTQFMPTQGPSASTPSLRGIRVLVVDDDDRVRSLAATLLRQVPGVSSVLEAKDGAEAIRVGRDLRVHVSVLDLNMPCVDGVDAALRLSALQPSMRIALHSSDPDGLRARAGGLGLQLFDKAEFECVIDWVERQARSQSSNNDEGACVVAELSRRTDLQCSHCGYGIVSRKPPERCPMCGTGIGWDEHRSRRHGPPSREFL